MVVHHEVDGYDGFCKFVDAMPNPLKEPYFFLFTGSKDENGVSWCPDCVDADPVIEAAVKKAPKEAHFVAVTVGDRPTWKDPNCPFRKDSRTKLLVIPTLMKWKSPQKLDSEQCGKPELVEMMFTEYDE